MKLYMTYARYRQGEGRHEHGDWVVHAGGAIPQLEDVVLGASSGNRARARIALSATEEAATADIERAEEIFVYVGLNAKAAAMDLIKRLLARGKRVTMTCCDCALEEKQEFADRKKIRMLVTNICGATDILDDLISGRIS